MFFFMRSLTEVEDTQKKLYIYFLNRNMVERFLNLIKYMVNYIYFINFYLLGAKKNDMAPDFLASTLSTLGQRQQNPHKRSCTEELVPTQVQWYIFLFYF